MQSDSQVLEVSTSQATIRLRDEQFIAMTRLLGCESDSARARLIGVTYRTIYRARRGVVGEVFIAQAIHGLRLHATTLLRYGLTVSFDNLFEVVGPESSHG